MRNKTQLSFLSVSRRVEGLTRALQTATMEKNIKEKKKNNTHTHATVNAIVSACIIKHRITKFPSCGMLYLCLMKNMTQKKQRAALLYFHCQLSYEV